MIGVVGCVLCGRRQVDPDSGPSLWRRGVRHGEQVLVCPQCQNDDGTDLLDRCASCGSSALAKRLGVVTCRECGATDDVVGAPKDPAHPPGSGRDALAADVAAAVDRVLGTEVAPRIDEP